MKSIRIYINACKIETTAGLTSGKDIAALAQLPDNETLLLDQSGSLDIPLSQDEYIVLQGEESFVTDTTPSVPTNPCRSTPIIIQLNNQTIDQADALRQVKIRATDIKSLDHTISPSENIYLDIEGLPDELLQDDQTLLLHRPLNFLSVPCGNVGYQSENPIIRSHFESLKALFPNASILQQDSPQKLLILHDFLLPPHWPLKAIDMLIVIPENYPSSPLDMFYVSPHLQLKNGATPSQANHFESFLGNQWQRFSWHLASRQWNPNQDTLLSHVQFCASRLMMDK